MLSASRMSVATDALVDDRFDLKIAFNIFIGFRADVRASVYELDLSMYTMYKEESGQKSIDLRVLPRLG